ncbi:hypothetical protein [Francisella frigiditurris]|uniref:Uncharacterized protein n=1 Tax=Francisella frigiditurris TaxID=1542390 RepID=A0A1J0KVW0_9GAMM|nr:hypothetical protein [Francisella frigiditurris]APC97855.1 hypothetical protein KX01_1198 [Francisella frigiditurris]
MPNLLISKEIKYKNLNNIPFETDDLEFGPINMNRYSEIILDIVENINNVKIENIKYGEISLGSNTLYIDDLFYCSNLHQIVISNFNRIELAINYYFNLSHDYLSFLGKKDHQDFKKMFDKLLKMEDELNVVQRVACYIYSTDLYFSNINNYLRAYSLNNIFKEINVLNNDKDSLLFFLLTIIFLCSACNSNNTMNLSYRIEEHSKLPPNIIKDREKLFLNSFEGFISTSFDPFNMFFYEKNRNSHKESIFIYPRGINMQSYSLYAGEKELLLLPANIRAGQGYLRKCIIPEGESKNKHLHVNLYKLVESPSLIAAEINLDKQTILDMYKDRNILLNFMMKDLSHISYNNIVDHKPFSTYFFSEEMLQTLVSLKLNTKFSTYDFELMIKKLKNFNMINQQNIDNISKWTSKKQWFEKI